MKAQHDKLSKENEVKITREVKYQWVENPSLDICLEEINYGFHRLFINSIQYKSF